MAAGMQTQWHPLMGPAWSARTTVSRKYTQRTRLAASAPKAEASRPVLAWSLVWRLFDYTEASELCPGLVPMPTVCSAGKHRPRGARIDRQTVSIHILRFCLYPLMSLCTMPFAEGG